MGEAKKSTCERNVISEETKDIITFPQVQFVQKMFYLTFLKDNSLSALMSMIS